jgi:hypothetical protein
MKQLVLNFPTFGFIVATRAALGVGLGLLIATRLTGEKRRAAGALLVGAGAVATIPALFAVARGLRRAPVAVPPAVSRDPALVGARRLPRKGDDDVI